VVIASIRLKLQCVRPWGKNKNQVHLGIELLVLFNASLSPLATCFGHLSTRKMEEEQTGLFIDHRL
jgi:hypothetical protein